MGVALCLQCIDCSFETSDVASLHDSSLWMSASTMVGPDPFLSSEPFTTLQLVFWSPSFIMLCLSSYIALSSIYSPHIFFSSKSIPELNHTNDVTSHNKEHKPPASFRTFTTLLSKNNSNLDICSASICPPSPLSLSVKTKSTIIGFESLNTVQVELCCFSLNHGCHLGEQYLFSVLALHCVMLTLSS